MVRMLAEGIDTKRGRRGTYLHRDAVNHVLRARKGARLTAITCGGAIPDNADYQVILEPAGIFVGTLNEDFAIESLAGDIFQLGNTSYRILRVEAGRVRVEDAKGQPPSIPFWLGEAPARTDELSESVSRLRADIEALLPEVTAESLARAIDIVDRALPPAAPGRAADGRIPGRGESRARRAARSATRWCSSASSMNPAGSSSSSTRRYGARVNRAFGLSLRKKFCRTFNFELQAAATEDAIVLSLGETHSFDLASVARFLNSKTVEDTLIQAMLDSPMFTARWRWNASISLAIRRSSGGKRTPPQIQRMASEDLIAVLFPDQIACAENLSGPREIPDHPLVKQTLHGLPARRHGHRWAAQFVDRPRDRHDQGGRQGSHRAFAARRGDPHREALRLSRRRAARRAAHARGLAAPLARSGKRGGYRQARSRGHRGGARTGVAGSHERRRTARCHARHGRDHRAGGRERGLDPAPRRAHRTRGAPRACTRRRTVFWVCAECLPLVQAVYPEGRRDPHVEPPAEKAEKIWQREEAITDLVRGRLQSVGPITARDMAATLALESLRNQHRAHRARKRRLRAARAIHRRGQRARSGAAGRLPRSSGASAACWRASIDTPSRRCAPRSSRCRARTSCASCSNGRA